MRWVPDPHLRHETAQDGIAEQKRLQVPANLGKFFLYAADKDSEPRGRHGSQPFSPMTWPIIL